MEKFIQAGQIGIYVVYAMTAYIFIAYGKELRGMLKEIAKDAKEEIKDFMKG